MGIKYLDEKQPKKKIRYLDEKKPSEPYLPGYEKTERLISERPSMLESLKEEAKVFPEQLGAIRKPSVKGFLDLYAKPAVTGLKGVGLLAERGEASIANLLMEIQKGAYPERDITKPFKEAWKGITGERRGEIGDVARRAGIPEPVAASIGLLSIVGLVNVLTKGQLVPKVTKAVKGKMPKVMGKGYTMQRAEKAVSLLDDTRTKLGENVGKSIDDVTEVFADQNKLMKEISRLPQNIQNALETPMYGIKKTINGAYRASVKNMHKITQALDDFMSTKIWGEAGKMSQKMTKSVYGRISGMMKQAAPSIKEPFNTYHRFMKLYRVVNKTLRDSSRTVLEKKIRGAFKPGAEYQYKQAWEKISQSIPEMKQIMKDMIKFTRRQGLKKGMSRAIRYGGGGYIGYNLLRNLFEGFGESGGGGGQEKR